MIHRLRTTRLIFLAAFGALSLRLVHLQLISGASYRRLAEQNRLRVVPEPAPRGLIVDRQGRILASSQSIFRVAVIPQETEHLLALLERVSALTRVPVAKLERRLKQEQRLPFLPATVVPRVSKEVALRLEEERWRWPGLLVKAETVRRYPRGSSAAHMLGYLSQPTAEELAVLRQYGIRSTSFVGRSGLEQAFDDHLRGQAGGLTVEVDHRARQVGTVGRRAPLAGERVALTIDAELQSLIEASLEGEPGACVVLEPTTGALLAMVSSPAFAPEAFAIGDNETIQALLDDPRRPLVNRATMTAYTPGSTAKLITAATALEHRVITPSLTFDCPGSLTIGDRVFHCWNRDGHGPMNLTEALMQSCNVYFMRVSLRLGVAGLLDGFRAVGLETKPHWLLEASPGRLPRRRLTGGEVAMLGIGQGEILVSPLQAALIASLFANGGTFVEPWVVSDVAGHAVTPPRPSRHAGWSPATIAAVREGMLEVVRNPDGTGHRAFSPIVSIAGKTGTAQTHVVGRPHGWFLGFCPVERPRAAFAIVVEHGGSGGDLPAAIGRTICEYLASVEPREEPGT